MSFPIGGIRTRRTLQPSRHDPLEKPVSMQPLVRDEYRPAPYRPVEPPKAAAPGSPVPSTVTVQNGDSYDRIAQDTATAYLLEQGYQAGTEDFDTNWHRLSARLVSEMLTLNDKRPLHTGDLIQVPDPAALNVVPPMPGTNLAIPGPLTEALGPRDTWVKSVDISKWSGLLTQAEVDELIASGVEHVVVGTQDPVRARQQLALLVANGLAVDAYVYTYFDRSPEEQVKAAMEIFKDFPVGTFYLDLEDEGSLGGKGPKELQQYVQTMVDTFNREKERLGLHTEVGIYTSRGFWADPAIMGNTNAFKDLPLWNAHWEDGVTLESANDDWATAAYGGWELPAGRQHGGDWQLSNGMDYDPNYMFVPSSQLDATKQLAEPQPQPPLRLERFRHVAI